MSLNTEQLAAANTRDGYFAVHAGPGSGKTTTLIARYHGLVADGAEPLDILALSFTAVAAKEMNERAGIEKISGRPSGFRTFHSLCLAFMEAERAHAGRHLAPFFLLDPKEQVKYFGEACRVGKVDYKRLTLQISEWKRKRITPAAALRAAEGAARTSKLLGLARAYEHYENLCLKNGVLDFDSIVIETVSLLERNAEVRTRWQYAYVMVDESQDADLLQWRLVQLLSEYYANVFAVGDVGQAIYQWRGAMPILFQDFEQLFPGATTLYLAKNHRSTKKIVEFCSAIAPDQELGKRFFTENAIGVEPRVSAFESDENEAYGVTSLIDGDAPERHAILARTNRQLVPFQMRLADLGISYKLLSKEDYWKQPEVKAVLAYVHLTLGSYADAAVVTALQAPFEATKFIPKKREIAEWLKPYEGGKWSMLANYPGSEVQRRGIGDFRQLVNSLQKFRGKPAVEVVRGVLAETRALECYAVDDDIAELNNRPVENLEELMRIAARFPSAYELLQYVWRLQAASRKRKGVSLTTVHGAKGLEWPVVFVVGVSEGLLPHKKGELDEEKRIWFVACSRAAEQLHISYHGTPSKFVAPFIRKPAEEMVTA